MLLNSRLLLEVVISVIVEAPSGRHWCSAPEMIMLLLIAVLISKLLPNSASTFTATHGTLMIIVIRPILVSEIAVVGLNASAIIVVISPLSVKSAISLPIHIFYILFSILLKLL